MRGPADVLRDPLVEVLRALSQTAKKGTVTLSHPGHTVTVGAGMAVKASYTTAKLPLPERIILHV